MVFIQRVREHTAAHLHVGGVKFHPQEGSVDDYFKAVTRAKSFYPQSYQSSPGPIWNSIPPLVSMGALPFYELQTLTVNCTSSFSHVVFPYLTALTETSDHPTRIPTSSHVDAPFLSYFVVHYDNRVPLFHHLHHLATDSLEHQRSDYKYDEELLPYPLQRFPSNRKLLKQLDALEYWFFGDASQDDINDMDIAILPDSLYDKPVNFCDQVRHDMCNRKRGYHSIFELAHIGSLSLNHSADFVTSTSSNSFVEKSYKRSFYPFISRFDTRRVVGPESEALFEFFDHLRGRGLPG